MIVAFGIVLSFLASIGFSLSNLLEKRAVDRMTGISIRRVGHMVITLLRSPLWLSGFLSGVVAVVLMTVSYSVAPITVVQSIFGAGLIFLVLASRLYLHEHVGRREWGGIAMMIVAVVLVSVTLTSGTRPGVGGTALGASVASAATALVAGLLFLVLNKAPIDHSISFAACSGLLYGVAALQTKSASVFFTDKGIVRAIPSIFASPYPYLFLICSVLGLLVFQTGLQRSRVAVLGPLTNILAAVYVVAVGMVIFNEPLPRSAAMTVLRFLGFAFVLIGSWSFASPSQAVTSSAPALVDEAESRQG